MIPTFTFVMNFPIPVISKSAIKFSNKNYNSFRSFEKISPWYPVCVCVCVKSRKNDQIDSYKKSWKISILGIGKQSKIHLASASFVLILVIYFCVTTHLELRYLEKNNYSLSFKFAGPTEEGSCVCSSKCQLGWLDRELEDHFQDDSLTWLWLKLAGAQLGLKSRHLGSFPCGPLCRVLELPYRMVAEFQDRMSQESGSGSCQFFLKP